MHGRALKVSFASVAYCDDPDSPCKGSWVQMFDPQGMFEILLASSSCPFVLYVKNKQTKKRKIQMQTGEAKDPDADWRSVRSRCRLENESCKMMFFSDYPSQERVTQHTHDVERSCPFKLPAFTLGSHAWWT